MLLDCFKALILGIIQGLTEFLPISSTAHLKIIPIIIGWEDPGLSVIASIQLGSVIAVIFYFREDLKRILNSFRFIFRRSNNPSSSDSRLFLSIVLGTFPIIIAGAFIKLYWTNYDSSFLRSSNSIAIVSIIMAIFLFLAEKSGKRIRSLASIRIVDGLIVGISQVLAIIPGVSRSGVTLTTSLFLGWDRLSAARYSFLLGIPAITLSGLVELKELLLVKTNYDLIPLSIGIISAALSSLLAIDLLLKYLQYYNTILFVKYRLAFGLSIILFNIYF